MCILLLLLLATQHQTTVRAAGARSLSFPKEKSRAAIFWFGLLRIYDRVGQPILALSREQIATECGLQTEYLNNITDALMTLNRPELSPSRLRTTAAYAPQSQT